MLNISFKSWYAIPLNEKQNSTTENFKNFYPKVIDYYSDANPVKIVFNGPKKDLFVKIQKDKENLFLQNAMENGIDVRKATKEQSKYCEKWKY